MLKFKAIFNQYDERFLVDNITSLLAIIDKDFIVRNANEVFVSTFYKLDEEVIDKSLNNILKCSYQEDEGKECMISEFCGFCNFRNDIISALNEKKSYYNKLFSKHFYIENEKKEKHFQYTVKPVKYNDENLCLLIMEDITEIFSKSQKLQEISNKKNELIGIAAHDIRSPLSKIKGILHLLISSDGNSNEIEFKKSLEQILSTVNYSLNLVDDILDSSALDTGELNLVQKKQSYGKFIAELVKQKQFLAKQKQIEIECEINSESEIYFDRIKIHQVFDNLIQNAIEYSPSNSCINVIVSEDESNVITEVRDEGVGISEKELDILFNQYLMEKKNLSRKRDSRGGLGLAIAKKIIRKHRGNIEVSSELGKGSVFRFTLPSI